jgi:hypothetical protein
LATSLETSKVFTHKIFTFDALSLQTCSQDPPQSMPSSVEFCKLSKQFGVFSKKLLYTYKAEAASNNSTIKNIDSFLFIAHIIMKLYHSEAKVNKVNLAAIIFIL